MDMTILDSLGGQAAVIKTGEGPQLNLTPDAETLALFAGLFAILQPREEGDDGQTSPGPDAGLETLSPGDTGQQVDIARSSLEALPAAARLMMDGLQAPSAPGEQPEMAESVSLARLLIAAKSLSSDKEGLPVATCDVAGCGSRSAGRHDNGEGHLARAIEILDDIDNESVQPVVGGVEPTWPSRPFLVRKWRSTRRDGYTCPSTHCRWKTIQKMDLWSAWWRNPPRHVNLWGRCRQSRSSKRHTGWLCRRRHRQTLSARCRLFRLSRRRLVRWCKSRRQ